MPRIDAKSALWENVLSLMIRAYGEENLTRLAREASVSPGTMSLIKAAQTSTGIEIIGRIADVFGVAPWQLLAPELGANLYVIEDNKVLPLLMPRVANEVPVPRRRRLTDEPAIERPSPPDGGRKKVPSPLTTGALGRRYGEASYRLKNEKYGSPE